MSSILDKCAEIEDDRLKALMKERDICNSSIFSPRKRSVKNIIKDAAFTYFRAILAGILIGTSGAIYLAVPNQILGSLLFSFGLLTIIAFNLPLFTGMVGYLFHDKNISIARLLIVLFGNCVGTNLMSWMVIPSAFWATIDIRVDTMVVDTISRTWYATLTAAMACGMFMYIAVEANNIYKDIRGAIITVMAVMGFILTGSLHSIANMFYIYVCRSVEFIQAGSMDYRPMAWIGLMVLGNAIGSQLVSWLRCPEKKEVFFG